jgi:hypothetical protein
MLMGLSAVGEVLLQFVGGNFGKRDLQVTAMSSVCGLLLCFSHCLPLQGVLPVFNSCVNRAVLGNVPRFAMLI